MKTIIYLSFACVLLLGAFKAGAQTRISFAKGTSEKTVSVTLPAKGERSFVLAVDKNQALIVEILGDLGLAVSVNLVNGRDGVDNWLDAEGGLEVLTGRKGDYIFSISNNSARKRTVKIRVRVGFASEYGGGTDPR
ncbi:MAG: hypothetical protein JSS81_02315 [Acidobacteria bacterium]|nr:hypothetical protein [Acidobacteriota bacterium]